MLNNRFATACLLSFVLATASAAQSTEGRTSPDEQARLAAGPMPGHSAKRAAAIWLQGNGPAEVELDFWPADDPEQVRSSPAQALVAEQQFAAQVQLDGLQPGTTYGYRVRLDGKPIKIADELMFHTQPLWEWRTEPPALRVITGSCAYINEAAYDRPGKPYGDSYGIFARMAEQAPDMMLWLGDNVYLREADLDSRWGMAERYRHSRALPELQPLLRGTHHYAIWDDHDYGPDDGNRSFILKDQSLELFKRYWANPSYGLPGEPGNFTTVSFAGIDFFLLDNRYHRNSDAAPDTADKSMLGAEQLAWLRDALLHSEAPFKLIANGNQMLNQFQDRESWRNFPAERGQFLAWLQETGVEGVVFLSGDTHFTALTRLERQDNYPLYELSCSPLTAGPRAGALPSLRIPPLPDTFVGERNFCQLDFSGPAQGRHLSIRVFDANGKQKWQRDIAAAELRSDR